MARYKINLTVESTNISSVEKKLREAFGAPVPVHTTEKLTTPAGRAARLDAALQELNTAKDAAESEINELRDELQNWLDGMPENLQGSSKAEELQTAIDELESLVSEVEDITVPESNVDFPTMF